MGSSVNSTDYVYAKWCNGGWQGTGRSLKATYEKKVNARKSVRELKFRCIFIG